MRALAALAVVAMLAGCAQMGTVVGGFRPDLDTVPEDAVREAARQIEEAVQQGAAEVNLAEANGVVLDTERIRQAVRTRALRSEAINEFRDTGFGVEDDNGLLYVERGRLYSNATTRRERDRNAMLVMSENNDRWAIYEDIVRANGLPSGAKDAVRYIFFEERIRLMPEGQPHSPLRGVAETQPQ